MKNLKDFSEKKEMYLILSCLMAYVESNVKRTSSV